MPAGGRRPPQVGAGRGGPDGLLKHLLQTLLATSLLYGPGLGPSARLSRAELLVVAILTSVVTLLADVVYRFVARIVRFVLDEEAETVVLGNT